MAIHLPDEQLIYFQDGNEEGAAQRAETRSTTLTAYFTLNTVEQNARQYLYSEIAHYYVFHQDTTPWQARQRGADKVVPRMYSVSPKDVERFHLRLLLQNVRGAENFNDLKTVNGVLYNTFKLAAINRNLVDDVSEWIKCIDEASTFSMPRQLRLTFALICIFNSPKDPQKSL